MCTLHRAKEQENRATSVDVEVQRHKSFWSTVRALPGRAKMQPHLISFIQCWDRGKSGVEGSGRVAHHVVLGTACKLDATSRRIKNLI